MQKLTGRITQMIHSRRDVAINVGPFFRDNCIISFFPLEPFKNFLIIRASS
jgi:hypothetical protein